MRIDNPDWIGLDYVTYETASLNVAHIAAELQPGLAPAMTTHQLGDHPMLLDLLDVRMQYHSRLGDWTARLWSVQPVVRMPTPANGGAIWKADEPERTMEFLLHQWQARAPRPITAILVTWACSRVPRVDRVIDLRDMAVPTHQRGAQLTIQVAGRSMMVRRFQQRDEPPISAAYDYKSRTLYWIA